MGQKAINWIAVGIFLGWGFTYAAKVSALVVTAIVSGLVAFEGVIMTIVEDLEMVGTVLLPGPG